MSWWLDPLKEPGAPPTSRDYPATASQYLGASFMESAGLSVERSMGRGARAEADQYAAWRPGQRTSLGIEPGRLLEADEANDIGKNFGVKVEGPISEYSLSKRIEWAQEKAAHESTFARARAFGDVPRLQWVASGGLALLADAADPLALAANFLPVVGPARHAIAGLRRIAPGLAERAAAFVPTSRFGVGAVEATGGNVALEALTYQGAREMDPDYGLLDSILNIAVGGAVGGGLHWFGGKVSDWWGAHQARAAGRPSPQTEPAGGRLPPETGETRETADTRGQSLGELIASGNQDAALDRIRRAVAGREDVPQAMARAIELLAPETKETTLRLAIAQITQDRRLDVEVAVRNDPAWRPPSLEAERAWLRQMAEQAKERRETWDWLRQAGERHAADVLAEASRQLDATVSFAKVPDDFVPAPEIKAMARRVKQGSAPEPLPRIPYTLATWFDDYVKERGGVRATDDLGVMLKERDMGRSTSSKGTRGQNVIDAAIDDGFFPEAQRARGDPNKLNIDPSVGEFVEALERDRLARKEKNLNRMIVGEKDYTQHAESIAARANLAQLRDDIRDMYGKAHDKASQREIEYALTLAQGDRQRMAYYGRLADPARGPIDEVTSLEVADRLDLHMADVSQRELELAARRLEEYGGRGEMLDTRVEGEPVTLADLDRLARDMEDAGAGYSETAAARGEAAERRAGGAERDGAPAAAERAGADTGPHPPGAEDAGLRRQGGAAGAGRAVGAEGDAGAAPRGGDGRTAAGAAQAGAGQETRLSPTERARAEFEARTLENDAVEATVERVVEVAGQRKGRAPLMEIEVGRTAAGEWTVRGGYTIGSDGSSYAWQRSLTEGREGAIGELADRIMDAIEHRLERMPGDRDALRIKAELDKLYARLGIDPDPIPPEVRAARAAPERASGAEIESYASRQADPAQDRFADKDALETVKAQSDPAEIIRAETGQAEADYRKVAEGMSAAERGLVDDEVARLDEDAKAFDAIAACQIKRGGA